MINITDMTDNIQVISDYAKFLVYNDMEAMEKMQKELAEIAKRTVESFNRR
jgi:hypothetical protein